MTGRRPAWRKALRSAGGGFVLALTVVGPLPAQHPNHAQGFRPEHVFDLGSIEHVNLFNGNLTLTIPVGPSYPVGPELSYGLTLTWTGNLWEWEERIDPDTDEPYLQAEPRAAGRTSAGFGWELGLGRLLDEADPANPQAGDVYQSPDQALHPVGAGSPSVDVVRSRDGTYLRHTRSQEKVESPDGTVRLFGPHGLVRMEDPFGNGLTIDYLNPDALGDPRLWRITDDHGRVQRVFLDRLAGRLVVDRVELTRFGGASPAVYDLSYATPFVPRACNDPVFAGNTGNVRLPLLTGVVLPDGSAYSMPQGSYHLDGSAPCGARAANGHLEHLDLPTGGSFEWDWTPWLFPEESRHLAILGGGSPLGEPFTRSVGLAARRHGKRTGSVLGTWTYDQSLEEAPGTLRDTESRTEVTDPLGHRTLHHFSVYHDDRDPATTEPPGWDLHEYGLPFTRRVSDGTSPGRFLSRQVFHRDGALLRSVYVRYERDGASPDNPRMASRRTVYPQDGGRVADLDRSDFDGLGHYRRQVASGTFPGAPSRTTFTRWNPDGAPGDAEPWILDTYDLRQVTEPGRTVTREAHFRADGFLRRTRTRKGAACGPEDVIMDRIPHPNPDDLPDFRGFLRLEHVYGGDGASLPCGALASLALPAQPVYRKLHTHACGVLAKTEWLEPGSGPLAFLPVDRTIHCPTGLVSSSRDVSGLQTTFSYDDLGRLTLAAPGAGEARTKYSYGVETANLPARVAVERLAADGSVLTGGQIEFDGFGRVARETRALPGGGRAERVQKWTARGDLFERSEWHAEGAASGSTVFGRIDPYGRPGRIHRPDGHTIEIGYFGMGRRTIDVPVATASDALGEPILTTARTTEFYDRFGRLHELREPALPDTTRTRTLYEYDPQGNLTRVNMNVSRTPTQVRTFTYDDRGFLTSETHPELGTSIRYSDYDPLGNPGRIERGGRDLRYSYDAASRLTEVRETGTTRIWKSWEYAEGSEDGTWGRGKLASASRHNRVLVPGTSTIIEPVVTERYEYGGVGGRISRVRTELNLSSDPVFEYELAYDALGNVTSRDYPRCSDATPFDGDTFHCFEASSGRTVSQTFSQGLLASIPGYASSVTYHPNGLVHEVAHGNGVTDVQENDPQDMARPARLRTRGASKDFDSGAFGYDGTGNVTKTGPNRFLYDALSRVVSAEVTTTADSCGEDEEVQFVTYPGEVTVETCGEIAAGPSVTVGSTGDLTFRAGERVVLRDGFRVEFGGRFVAEIDPSVEPAGGTAEATWEGEYDRFGNLTSLTTQRPGETAVTHTPVPDPSTNRLVTVGTTYDTSGNVTARPGWSYSYDPFNMLWQAQRTATGTGFTFVYGPGDERLWTIDWTQGTGGEHWLETWTLRDLDGSPLRQFRTEGGNASGNWSLFGDYVYRDGALFALHSPDALHHFHLDHLGTPRLVTEPNGATLAYHAYFPFGEEATSPADSIVPLQYTGHERDDLDSGGTKADLDYQHARYFSANLGRFHSPDPLNGSIVNPQSWNRYAYVLGNPLKYVDPYGMAEIDTCATSGSDEEEVRCEGTIDVIGEDPGFDPLTGVPGLGALRTGRALLAAIDSGLVGTRSFYHRRFEQNVAQGNELAAFIDFVGLELLIPQSSGELGTEILLSAVPIGKAGRLAKIATRNVQGGKTTTRAVLKGAERWLGPGYKEVAPGVFRSADGKRQFRMTTDDLTDASGPHVHFEAVAPDGRQFIENAHVYLVDP